MKLYKLTEQDGTTHNKSMSWEVGITNHVMEKDNPQMCSGDVIHAYKNKNLAFMLNPIHADIKNPLLFECKGEPVISAWDKCGVFELSITKKLSIPKWYKSKKTRNYVLIQFAILCVESVLHYYTGKYPTDDRPQKAIDAAKEYLKIKSAAAAYAADAAAYAADAAATYAATAATYAADAAATYAAAAAAYAADAAADADAAATAATYAAYAADAADAAAYAADELDFSILADKAVKMIMDK